jgi:DNA-binding NarL/FixJ family response regulator
MALVVVVADATTVLEDVRAAIEDEETEIVELRSGEQVRPFVLDEPPDLVIADCQVQNMGGIAVAFDLKLEESGGRIPHVPVLVLLDRRADVFLARRAAAEGFLVKPLDPIRLRRATEALLAGDTYHDESYRPVSLQGARPA